MKSLEQLHEICERMRKVVQLREENAKEILEKAAMCESGKDADGNTYRTHVLVCGGTGCTSSGSARIRERLEKEIEANGLSDEVCVVKTGCFGLCALGPIMIVYPEGTFYSMVQEEDIPEIVTEHLLKGNVVKHLLYEETVKADKIIPLNETNFYKKQHRVALRNCGVINPEKIDEYIGTGGYEALGIVLTEKKPEDVIQILLGQRASRQRRSRIPDRVKIGSLRQEMTQIQKYVCCNADEGDPGAFMDRSILEGDPHAVLEAMAIAGYAIGASQGYIYVRAEYPIAVQRLEIAIEQAREYGLLGKNIFDSGFDFDIELRLGAGAFVCGEETALMTSIEGNRGEPRPRPPFPALKGLFQKPTILNNVETYANIPQIIVNGPEWFASMGTEKSKGTKVFALGGKIHNTGLVEIPMGTTLREIVEEIGGGVPNGKKFKAAQTGGPSGGCIPAEHLDIPIDYDNLLSIGSMMGSGGLIVMDEDTCMVDIAKFFLEFTVDESCGKCTPCRIGTRRMLEILEKITKGQATMEDLDKLEELCYHLQSNSLCALGQTAPNPVLSTLRYFRDEYIAHIVDKKCPAGVCKDLLQYKIDPDKCKGCTLCARTCPADAIIGKVKEVHMINPEKCLKCGACMEKCRFGAIYKE